MTGRLVILNGPSSSGKTTLAESFAAQQDTPWLVFPVDLLHAVRSRPDKRPQGSSMSGHEWQEIFRRTRAGYHRALAGLAEGGNDVIGDHVLSEPWRLADLLEVTRDVPVLLVHVTAEPSVLAAREQTRGDRDPGTALAQRELVFTHDDCDLLIDTGRETTATSVERLTQSVADWPATTAFERLRRLSAARSRD